MEKDIKNIQNRNRRKWLFFIVSCIMATLSCRLRAETVDIPTSYPSPSGSYIKLVTTGDSGPANTTLNSNGGNTILVPPVNPDGKVGIGVATPAKELDVAGDIAAAGVITAAGDVKVGTSSAITRIVCGPGLDCSREDNILKIVRVNMGSCSCFCTPTGYGSRGGQSCQFITVPPGETISGTGQVGTRIELQKPVSDNTGCTVPCLCSCYVTGNPGNCVGSWSACSNGIQTYIITTPASGGGAACSYQSGQVRSCAQSVNCIGSWGACSATCGGGSQTYNITTQASGGGAACPYQSGQAQACNTQACACVPNLATCNAPQPACGQVTYGTTNCGTGCQKTAQPCPPAQGSCNSTCTSRYFMSGVGACGGSIQVPCVGRGTVGQSVQCSAPASFCGGIDIYQACYTYCTAR